MIEDKVHRKLEHAGTTYLSKAADGTFTIVKKKWQAIANIAQKFSEGLESATESENKTTAVINMRREDLLNSLRAAGVDISEIVLNGYIGIIKRDTGIVYQLQDYKQKLYR